MESVETERNEEYSELYFLGEGELEVLRREGMSGKGSSTTLGEVEVGSAETGRNEWERG